MKKGIDKTKRKCFDCNKIAGFPSSLCWVCEKPLCKECSGVLGVILHNKVGTPIRCTKCENLIDKTNAT